MVEKSRIRFNPVTREIEIEGSEKFVRVYFGKVQKLFSVSADQEEKQKSRRMRRAGKPEKMKKKPGLKKVAQKGSKKIPKETLLDKVVRLIRGSQEGITTAALKEKTRLSENQIWNIVHRAEKQGKIKKARRGIYTAA
jgi:uncharacterized membrane protein